MARRQKMLVALVSIMFVAYFADLAFRRLYANPLQELHDTTESMRQQLRDAKLDRRREQNKLRQLPVLERQSLPKNLEVAVTEYRGWLLQLVQDMGLAGASVNSAAPTVNRDAFVRIAFLIRGHGTLQQITEFLLVFYDTEYLHSIRSMSLNPASDGRIRLTMTIEALALPTASQSEFPLISPTKPVELAEYHLIARRNLFAAGDPIAEKIVLSAITSDTSGHRQAWITDPTGRVQFLTAGESMSYESFGLTVERVEPQFVEIISDGQRQRIKIGQRLANADKIMD